MYRNHLINIWQVNIMINFSNKQTLKVRLIITEVGEGVAGYILDTLKTNRMDAWKGELT